MEWLLYGASGYTGMLIAKAAAKRGLNPILAGRTEPSVATLARNLKLRHRIFTLDNPAEVQRGLEGVQLVLNCAGPFSATFDPLVAGCLESKCHYLDITGEIELFEKARGLSLQARTAGVCLIPGVGFDVVPSDCLAAALARRLANADHLEIAILPAGGVSRGTLKTSVEGLPKGALIRRDGKLKSIPWGSLTRVVTFAPGAKRVAAIPWGDLATAFYSTSIPNISVYMALPTWAITAFKLTRPFTKLFARPPVQKFLKARIDKRDSGPSAEVLSQGRMYLWGQVSAKNGQKVEATLETAEGYQFTVNSSIAVVEQMIKKTIAPGYWTPSQAFGPDFVKTLPGTKLHFSTGQSN